MLQYESIEYKEQDSKIIIKWGDGFKIEDLASFPRRDNHQQIDISNFKIYKKTIDNLVSLKNICFIDNFLIMDCVFITGLELNKISIVGDCEIMNNAFASFSLVESTLSKIEIIYNVVDYYCFQIMFNNIKYLTIRLNKFACPIHFISNNTDKLDIEVIEFIESVNLRSLKDSDLVYDDIATILPLSYFINLTKIKKIKVNWDSFRISLCNLKGYYLSRHDYFTSLIFEELEEKAYHQASLSNDKGWSKFSIYIKYLIKKYSSIFISWLSLLIALFSLFITLLSWIQSYIL